MALGVLTACSPTPPPTATRADLVAGGIAPDLARKLELRQPLSPAQLERVMGPTGLSDPEHLALVAENPGVPASMLEMMATHPSSTVREGVAANPRTPAAVLLKLRRPGPGHRINGTLAKNPSMPPEVLREMSAKGEVGAATLAANPALPHDLMLSIARQGDLAARLKLVDHPALTPEALQLLRADESDELKQALAARPAVKR